MQVKYAGVRLGIVECWHLPLLRVLNCRQMVALPLSRPPLCSPIGGRQRAFSVGKRVPTPGKAQSFMSRVLKEMQEFNLV